MEDKVLGRIQWNKMTSISDFRGYWVLKVGVWGGLTWCSVNAKFEPNRKGSVLKRPKFDRFDVEWPMSYRNVLYLLNCNFMFRFAIVVLLGCCEFNPNVTCLRIHVCPRIAIPTAAGVWKESSGSAKWGMFLAVSANKEKNRVRDIDSLTDKV